MTPAWEIKPSTCFIGIVVLFYLLSLFALCVPAIPFLLRSLLLVLLLLDGVRVIYFKLMLKAPDSMIQCVLKENQWGWRDRAGQMHWGNLLPNTVMWPWCVILRFREPKKRPAKTFIIFRDTFQASDDFRRLKYLLYLARA